MPISNYLSDKWDRLLYNWWVWFTRGGEGLDRTDAKISSIYDPSKWRRGTARASDYVFLPNEGQNIDALLRVIRGDKAQGGDRVYEALVEWVKDDGTRGAQAARLSMHQDTYKDIVDSGKRWLERLSKSTK